MISLPNHLGMSWLLSYGHARRRSPMVRRMLAAAGMTVMAAVVAAVPAWAAPGGTGPTPRAEEWWLATWKMQPQVWPLTEGSGVTVAVIDTGVQASVPDLRGAVVPGGDVTGRHTNGETDFNGHGTMMAVLIAGQGYGTGMVGMAPKAKILPVVVNTTADDLTSEPAAIAAGIIYAANHGARVIDVSQEHPSASATGCDATEQAAVAYAVARDVVVVAAAGDTNLIGAAPAEPASCAGVLAVAALRPNRVLWPENASQPYLTVVNPGADLITSGSDGRLVTGVSGTRAASALAAGAVALIRSRYPALHWYQVIQRVTGTALQEGSQVPNDSFGYGIFRLSHAIDAATYPVSASAPNPVYIRYRALLATSQRAATRRPGTASAGTSKSGSTAPALIAVLALLALVGLAALFVRLGRTAARRPQVRGQRNQPTGMRAGQDESIPYPGLAADDADSGYLIVGEQKPYRVPPYMPPPSPSRKSTPTPLRTSLLAPDDGNG